MLRWLAGLLLLANLAFWALTQEPVAAALGLTGDDSRDPARLARQVHPDKIRILPSSAAGTGPGAAASSAAALACLESGPLDEAQARAATAELLRAGIPAGAWVDMRRELPSRWLVYMGRFADREQMRRKEVELQRMNLAFEELTEPADLAPSLVLAEFDTQAEAEARLAQLRARGVRTAKVGEAGPGGAEHRLRVDRLPPDRRDRLQALSAGAGPAAAAAWRPCAPS